MLLFTSYGIPKNAGDDPAYAPINSACGCNPRTELRTHIKTILSGLPVGIVRQGVSVTHEIILLWNIYERRWGNDFSRENPQNAESVEQ